MKILVFPSCIPEALAFSQDAALKGQKIIAASSLDYDETASSFSDYYKLPTIYDEVFTEALSELIDSHDITQIFCAHPTIFLALEHAMKHGALKAVPLLGENPLQTLERQYHTLLERAQALQKEVDGLASSLAVEHRVESSLKALSIAALCREYEHIFGQSNESKLVALMGIAPSTPCGDIVEIGCLYGKSAFALLMLAKHCHIGSLLMVDPWDQLASIQGTGNAQKANIVPAFNYDLAWQACCVNLMLHAQGDCNYIRYPSTEAAAVYEKTTQVTTDEFGCVKYRGKIAILHIDGNHEYDAVKSDYSLWAKHVVSGGWIILDDYYWLGGGGPKRLGDELLLAEQYRIETAFVCGKSLFIKRK